MLPIWHLIWNICLFFFLDSVLDFYFRTFFIYQLDTYTCFFVCGYPHFRDVSKTREICEYWTKIKSSVWYHCVLRCVIFCRCCLFLLLRTCSYCMCVCVVFSSTTAKGAAPIGQCISQKGISNGCPRRHKEHTPVAWDVQTSASRTWCRAREALILVLVAQWSQRRIYRAPWKNIQYWYVFEAVAAASRRVALVVDARTRVSSLAGRHGAAVATVGMCRARGSPWIHCS